MFTFAGTNFSEVPVDVSETRAGAFASRSIAGNIGSGILSRFRVTFDYRARTVTFLPNEEASAPFHRDWTGLSFTQKSPNEIIILNVIHGSAADSDGIRAGDAIIEVNGVSVADRHLGVFDLAPLSKARAPLVLTLRRDGRAVKLTVVPRRSELRPRK